MTLSGTLTISPTSVAFNGSRCLLSWTSVGAERVWITGLGDRQPVGVEYVYPTGETTYTARFTNYGETVEASATILAIPDPLPATVLGTVSGRPSTLMVSVVRNLNAGRTAVNTRRLTGEGTPSYIIASRVGAPPEVPPADVYLLSGDDLGVL